MTATKRKPGPLSERAYVNRVRKQGNLCPFCLALDVEGGAVDIQGEEATQDASCLGCGRTWTDHYKLYGYTVAGGA